VPSARKTRPIRGGRIKPESNDTSNSHPSILWNPVFLPLSTAPVQSVSQCLSCRASDFTYPCVKCNTILWSIVFVTTLIDNWTVPVFHYSLSVPSCAMSRPPALESFRVWKNVQTTRSGRGLDVASWIVDRRLNGFHRRHLPGSSRTHKPALLAFRFYPGLASLPSHLPVVTSIHL
jgi:hypothetical protein